MLQPIFINDALFLGSGKKQEIINLENYEDDSLKSWVNQLDDNKRVYWNLLSKREKNEYLFMFNELNKKSSKIQAKIKKKKAKKLVMTKKRVKSGISKFELNDLILYCKDLNLNLMGLMCIPPEDNDRSFYFKEMNNLNKQFKFSELSMGMSSDYLQAIQNSATYLRIGSSIFGNRY